MQIFEGQIRFGIHAGQQNISFADYLDIWRTAEVLGYDWASVYDHFQPIKSDPSGSCFEALAMVAALAAHTKRIRCGILVVNNSYRNPAVLAKIAATIDHISNGRLELGIGSGWVKSEHDQYGIAFPPTGSRIRMLGESAKILKSLWTEYRTTLQGRYYTITDAVCEPKPVQKPHIPLWIGGMGERLTLRVVAESADGWNTFLMPRVDYIRKLDVLAARCKDVGRDPGDIRKSIIVEAVVGETEKEVEERCRSLSIARKMSVEHLLEQSVVGTPERCIEQLMGFFKLGVSDFIVAARPPTDMRALELVAQKVAPVVKQEGKGNLDSR